VVCDCQRDGSQSKVIVFLSTQDSVEFHYLLLSDCLRTNAADAATDTQLQLFKLHGDLPQKVNLQSALFIALSQLSSISSHNAV